MKNHRNLVCITLIMLLSSASLLAQSAIRGRVTEKESGNPIPFVYVYVKGSSVATSTSDDGTYMINVGPNATLVFSSLGYVTVEEVVGNRATINVSLAPDTFNLEEVIAVAYATTRRRDLIASVATVRGDDIAKTPVASLNEAMQGKMAGVQISSASGTPGGAIVVRIRGSASITAGNDPLYVIDGIPMVVTDYSQMAFGGQTTNPIASINPSDIENIQVLKDAAASALYGSRASNGVVLITTKSGRAQKAKVTFDASYGVRDLFREVQFLGTDQWLMAQNEARTNFNKTFGYVPGDSRYVSPISAEVLGADTDWFKEVTKQNPMTANIQVGVSGGTDNTQFYLSAGYYKEEGIQKTTQYDRYTFRTRISHRFNSRVRIDVNTSFSTTDQDRLYGDNNIFGPIFNASRNRPDQPIYDPNDPTRYYPTIRNNPVACFQEMYGFNRQQRLMGRFLLEWNVVDNLVFRSSLNATYTYIHELAKFYPKSPQAALWLDESRDYNTYLNDYLVENTLSYNKVFGKLSTSALIGQSFLQNQITRNHVFATGFPIEGFRWIETASVASGFSSSFREFLMESYFGRLSASIDDKYLIEGTIRSDASSKFAKEHRVGYFPSGSLGWRVSKESFFPQSRVLTDAKIRGSIGLTGNQDGIPHHRYLTLYGIVGYDDRAGAFPQAAMSTRDLTWEKTLQTDIGLDLIFLNGRIEFTYDYFTKNTRDLLLTISVPITTGHTTKTENIGKMKTTGHEFSVFSRNVVRKFRWSTSFNITYFDNKSIVTALSKNPAGEWEFINTGVASRIDVGYPLSTFHVIKALGIYQNDSDVPESLYRIGVRAGDVMFEDFNGDGQISAADRQMNKSGMPTAYGGLTNTFSFKGFDAEVGLQFSIGNYMYTYWKETDGAANGGRSNFAIMKEHWENRWTPENPHNNPMYPRFVSGGTSGPAGYNTQARSTLWLQDASFLRVKSLTLGYTLPSNISQKIQTDRVRFYVNAHNLFTFTKYDGMDPEVHFSPTANAETGVDFFTVPQMRSFTFGINISF